VAELGVYPYRKNPESCGVNEWSIQTLVESTWLGKEYDLINSARLGANEVP
jgi:hypothetical protein